jgi:hypothetical protein
LLLPGLGEKVRGTGSFDPRTTWSVRTAARDEDGADDDDSHKEDPSRKDRLSMPPAPACFLKQSLSIVGQ